LCGAGRAATESQDNAARKMRDLEQASAELDKSMRDWNAQTQPTSNMNARKPQSEGDTCKRVMARKNHRVTEKRRNELNKLTGNFNNQSGDEQDREKTSPNKQKHRQKKRHVKQTRHTKHAGSCIATINMKGFGNKDPNHAQNKWHHVNQIMRDKRISVLAVQEAHMDEDRRAETEKIHGQRLRIFASADKDKPTAKAGVAIVFNRDLLDTSQICAEEVIPGQAMLAKFQLRRGTKVIALAVYAHNNPSANAKMWGNIMQAYIDNPNLERPNMIIGDFNMVEDAIDRMPSREDQRSTVTSLQSLKTMLSLEDGWRETFPDKLEFTYMQNRNIHSRIDRIYITHNLLETSIDWRIEPSGIPESDHDLASVVLTDPEVPNIGKGRWSFPEYLLKDKIFIEDAIKTLKDAQTKMDSVDFLGRTNQRNQQKVLAAMKKRLRERAKERDNEIVPKIVRKETELKARLDETAAKSSLNPNKKVEKIGELRKALRETAEKRHLKKRKCHGPIGTVSRGAVHALCGKVSVGSMCHAGSQEGIKLV
jgi:hypothetical protein